MAGLVERAGGPENAARLIDARMGRALDRDSQSNRKGTISKRLAGHLAWPLDEIMALEDALRDPCVRRWLAQTLPEIEAGRCLMQGVAAAAREHGEAMEAVLAYAARPATAARARARKEAREALEAAGRLLAQLDQEGQADV